MRGACRVWVERSKGKRPFRRPRPRLEYNIKMVIQVVGWGDTDGIDLAQDRER